ncbi:hypothetical protein NECAME_17871, partial [Necator americanus]
EERKDVGNDVKKIVKRDIDKDYSVDYNPSAGDETEEDENDPMRTKVFLYHLSAKPCELGREFLVLCGSCCSTLAFQLKSFKGQVSLGGFETLSLLRAVTKMFNEPVVFLVDVVHCEKKASYRSFFEYRCSGTRDIAILELTADVPEHIHHICLPHMNKKIDISDSSLRMSSFGWGGDREFFLPVRNKKSQFGTIPPESYDR